MPNPERGTVKMNGLGYPRLGSAPPCNERMSPNIASGLHGKKGTFGGEVRVYETDPKHPVGDGQAEDAAPLTQPRLRGGQAGQGEARGLPVRPVRRSVGGTTGRAGQPSLPRPATHSR